jgi:hypothetical protein
LGVQEGCREAFGAEKGPIKDMGGIRTAARTEMEAERNTRSPEKPGHIDGLTAGGPIETFQHADFTGTGRFNLRIEVQGRS